MGITQISENTVCRERAKRWGDGGRGEGEGEGGEGSGEGEEVRRREEEGKGEKRGRKVGSYMLRVKIDLMLLVLPILVFVLHTGGISMLCLLV